MSRSSDLALSSLLEELAVVAETSADQIAMGDSFEEALEIYALVQHARIFAARLARQNA